MGCSLLALAVAATPVRAQQSLTELFHNYPQGAVKRCFAADVSGDGLEDLVLHFGTLVPHIVLNTPGTGFGDAQPVTAAPWVPARVAVGDLDGDGRAEIAMLHADKTHLVVLHSTGGASFEVGLSLVLPDQVAGLALLDIDGDGQLDIVAGRRGDALALVLLNTGGLQFVAASDIPAVMGATLLACADVTGDGEGDLVSAGGQVAGEPNDIVVSPGLGGGAFGAAQPVAAVDVARLAVGDFTGDGTADVAYADVGPDVLVRAGGPAGLGPPATLATDNPVGAIVAADLNRDGRLDLAVAESGIGSPQPLGLVSIWLQQPDGMLLHEATAGSGKNPNDILAADLDHDGAMDLVIGNGAHMFAFGQGDGAMRNVLGFPDEWASALAISDCDGDGLADLLAGSEYYPTAAHLFASRPVGSFAAPSDVELGVDVHDLAVADLTGDGIADIVTCGHPSHPVPAGMVLCVGLGNGDFGVATLTAAGYNPQEVELADLDGDGDLDVVVSSSSIFPDEELNVVHNDGAGGMHLEQGVGLVGVVYGMQAADVNHDGRADLGVLVIFDDAFVQLLAQPDGTLQVSSSTPLVSNLDSPYSVAYDDLDGDGLLDALVAEPHYPVSNLRLLHGLGNGSFTPLGVQTLPNSTERFELVDMDGDQLLDLVLADPLLQELVVWPRIEGTGVAPWFGTPVPTALPGYVAEMAVGDLDGDGAPDVVTAEAELHHVDVWHNVKGPWKDLGHSLADTSGFSRLAGAGSLEDGTDVLLLVEHAAPLTPAILVVGLAQLDMPFKGGVLVPQPDLLLSGLVTDADGELLLTAPWLAGVPSDLSFVMQAWLGVPGSGAGLAATNGLSGTTP